ncbi:hypothetical protein C3495_10665 [Clostridiaceae bacterium 14S0207]|nr:hypothetical protein C3495_10665 [Clostridiaceae bacterium 14S0207]
MEYLNKFMIIIFLFIYVYFLYIFMRINIKNVLWIKKCYLWFNGLCNVSKESFMEGVKVIYLGILTLIPILFGTFKGFKMLIKIVPTIGIIKSVFLFLLSFFTIIQILFFVMIVLVEVIMKQDSRKQMQEIKWIKFNRNRPLYTGIIKPLCYSLWEVVILYNIFFYILNNKLKLNIFLVILILSLLYSFSKLIAIKTIPQALIYGIWAFCLCLCSTLVLIYSGGILISFLIFLSFNFLVAFKE